jgi:hypothetical protein
VLEDGDAGVDPHEHLYEVDEDRHKQDGVGGEVLQLKPELLQEQKEEGGDRRGYPAGHVRVEEDEFPHDQVVEGTRTCPDLPSKFRRGPTQEAAHRVELLLTRMRGEGPCGSRKGKGTGRKEQITKVRREAERVLQRLEKASAKR